VLFGVIAFLSVVLELDLARGHLAIALPLGLIGLLVNRPIWRGVAARKRAKGEYQTSLLVVGSSSAAAEVAAKLVRARELGFYVVGLWTPEGPTSQAEPVLIASRDVPVVGVDTAVIDAVKRTGADTVAMSPTDHLTPVAIRRLIWDLEALGVDLIVTAGLIDVAAERISSQPVAGMAMLLVDKPQYDHANSWAKRAFDVCFASMALIALSPVMLLAAVEVKASSRGPVFYRAERIGINDVSFEMLKFRSMVDGADAELTQLMEAAGSDTMFFKIKNDPRVTPVGRVLRKFSIDELPQFINVVTGDMSVVGPRPPGPPRSRGVRLPRAPATARPSGCDRTLAGQRAFRPRRRRRDPARFVLRRELVDGAGAGHHRPDRSGCAARPRGVLTRPCRPTSYGSCPGSDAEPTELCVDISGKMVHEAWSWRD